MSIAFACPDTPCLIPQDESRLGARGMTLDRLVPAKPLRRDQWASCSAAWAAEQGRGSPPSPRGRSGKSKISAVRITVLQECPDTPLIIMVTIPSPAIQGRMGLARFSSGREPLTKNRESRIESQELGVKNRLSSSRNGEESVGVYGGRPHRSRRLAAKLTFRTVPAVPASGPDGALVSRMGAVCRVEKIRETALNYPCECFLPEACLNGTSFADR